MEHFLISQRYRNQQTTAMSGSSDLMYKYPDLINFSIGDPDLTTNDRIIRQAFEDARAGHTHYTEVYGQAELREEIVKFLRDEYNLVVSTKEIMVTTSGCHAMWLVMEAMLSDGDEVLIPSPHFTPYTGQVGLARGVSVLVETREEDGFEPVAENLRRYITPRTKAIIINTPNNPTGACYKKESLEAVARLAEEKNLALIADDIYTAFSFENKFFPLSGLPGIKERTVTIRSFSKDYCMTGWRIGYIIAPEAFIETVKNINENNVFTAPSVSQRAALAALKIRKSVQEEIVEEYKRRMLLAHKQLTGLKNISSLPPRGSIYLFPNIKKTGLTSVEVAGKILDEAHVLTLPGSTFGPYGEGYLRLAVTVGEEKLNEAFERIRKMEIFQ